MADSLAKLSSIIESARDITIEAAVSASTRLTETPTAKRPQEIVKLLSSRLDRDVLQGMKCVMSLISSGDDGVSYFADVVKNVTLDNARVRALVMIYVEKYAQQEPDTALLAINSVQKSLADKTPNVRSASIRALGGIRILEIASLVLLCIKRTLSDRVAEVRSSAALAIGSAFSIEGIQKSQLLGHLCVLLADDSPLVVGTSVKVFMQLKLEFLKLLRLKTWAPIHANYRKYVRMLPDMDDWGKAALTDLLVEYCRRFVPRPILILPDESKVKLPDTFVDFPEEYSCEMDSDLESFVGALSLALYSASNMVVLSSTRALVLIATPNHIVEFGYPKLLVKMMLGSSSEPEKLLILELIAELASAIPMEFQHHARKFFIHPLDSMAVAESKLQILLAIFSDATAEIIIKELQYNAASCCRDVAKNSVRAIGFCCQRSASWTDKILRWCLGEMQKESASLILADLLKVVRFLLQQKHEHAVTSEQLTKTIYRLSLLLNNEHVQVNEEAKASIIWTIGEFTQVTRNSIGPDVLRQSLKTYAQEPEKVRYEILLLAAKSFLYEVQQSADASDESQTNSINKNMFDYTMHLARYDMSTSTRDRARMLDELFKDASNHELAYLFMQAPKSAPRLDRQNVKPTFLSRYMKKPSWANPSELPPSSIRKEVRVSKPSFSSFQSNQRVSNSPITTAVVNDFAKARFTDRPAPSNRLQSLDEFFGDEDESDESVGGQESSSDDSSVSESEDEESEYGSDSGDLLIGH